ncbi:hypothetical protein C2S51_033851 [Perilla frutescens var. frutescens]|nr:hypothetical protein C2S51_033851 [Perilla frutescens var. frutescens]
MPVEDDDIVPYRGVPLKDSGADFFRTACPPMGETKENIRALSRAEIIKCWADEQVQRFIAENFIEDVTGLPTLYEALKRYVYWYLWRHCFNSEAHFLLTTQHGMSFWRREERWSMDWAGQETPEQNPVITLKRMLAIRRNHPRPADQTLVETMNDLLIWANI